MKRILFLTLIVAPCTLALAGEGACPYGFAHLEIYKHDGSTFALQRGDVDGDAVGDLLLVNNQRARIDIYLRRPDGVEHSGERDEDNPNEIEFSNHRYERKELVTERQVFALTTGDWDGDGHLDAATFGKPGGVVVAFGDGKGSFPRSRTFDVEEGIEGWGALARGDLDGNGRDDLVLLAKNHVYLFRQDEKGALKEPERVPHAAMGAYGVLIGDVDGDDRDDLVLMLGNDPRPVRLRLQQQGGTLGPELALATEPFRLGRIRDVDGKAGLEFVLLQRSSGLLRVFKFTQARGRDDGDSLGSVETHPLPAGTGESAPSLALADADGDGRTDVVVSDPGSALIGLHLQRADGSLSPLRRFPALAEVSALAAADLDGDGRVELAMLSRREGAVGITTYGTDGRFPFPRSLRTMAEPRALGAGPLGPEGRSQLVVVGRDTDKKWVIERFGTATGDEAGKEVTSQGRHPLPGLESNDEPASLELFDIDQDGRLDVLLFDPFRPMRVQRQREDGSFEDASSSKDYGAGLVDRRELRHVDALDLDGDGKHELMVASKNFARGLVLEGERLVVRDQVNAETATARLESIVACDLDGDGQAEVVGLDGQADRLTLLRKSASGVFEPMGRVPLGTSAYQRLFAADLDGDARPEVVLLGKDRVGILRSSAARIRLEEQASYESPNEDARLYHFDVGDLNGDGRRELCVADLEDHALEIVRLGKESKRVLKWRAFEQKLHGGRGSRNEPREVLVGELTGDGLDDVAILVHDRLIVYPQDATRPSR